MLNIFSKRRGQKVLFLWPPYRNSQLYFRIAQYVDWCNANGLRVDVIFKKKYSRLAQRLLGFLAAVPKMVISVIKCDYLVLTPTPFLFPQVFLGRLARKKIIIEHFVSYISYYDITRKYPFFLDKLAYSMVDDVIVHTKSVRSVIIQRFGIKPGKVKTLYCVVDTSLFSPLSANDSRSLREILGLEDKFVVLYHGMHTPWHGIKTLEQSIQLLRKNKNIIFLILPKGKMSISSDNVIYLDEQKYEDLPYFINAADVWCSGFAVHPRGNRSFGSTLVQALAMAKPVITSPDGERTKILEDKITAYFVPPNKPKALAEKILYCQKNPLDATAVGRRGRQLVEAKFSLSKLDDVMSKIFLDK